jgi:2-aminobenzoate-CoA ligase
MNRYTAHIDTFCHDNLPPREQWPTLLWDNPELRYPGQLNCAEELLDGNIKAGRGSSDAIITPNERITYGELADRANRIARVLVDDLGLKAGNRVLIRSANNPQFLAAWFGIAKAGGVVVATMPLLRAKELTQIIDKAKVSIALCDERLIDEMQLAFNNSASLIRVCTFNGSGKIGAQAELESLMSTRAATPANVATSADDTVLIAFTSGTTGVPKGTMHFHRDVMAINDCFPRSTLNATENDIFIGSPPLAFTFGLGGLATFPFRAGASTVLLENASPLNLAQAIERFKPTICFTAPTAYRVLAGMVSEVELGSLKKCVSAGETLPRPTFELWQDTTGIRTIDGLGSTELLHIFIASRPEDSKAGATGKPIPGYEAVVLDEALQPVPVGEVGRLAVRGPTGCRYLADDRQTQYVQNGWNITGDAYRVDEQGYFCFEARADDMIISAGYNIAGPEVESALMAHPAVAECAVVASPDPDRGFIPKAYVVLASGEIPDTTQTKRLQDFVKATIAPYKYPREVAYVSELPKTETGKVQRFKLRQLD